MDSVDPETWRVHAESLQQALCQAPNFRKESSGQPLVYGYVRSARWTPRYLAACKRALDRYCERERLQLCTTFADQGVPCDAVARPGLSGLCDVLRLPDSFAAVIVSPNHLSSDPSTATAILNRLRATGARLLVVHPASTRHVGTRVAWPEADDLCDWWQ